MRSGRFIVRFGNDQYEVTVSPAGEARVGGAATLRVAAQAGGGVRVSEGARSRQVWVVATGTRRQVFVDGEAYDLTVETGDSASPGGQRPRPPLARAHAILASPMPARVPALLVEPGRRVERGELLLKLEAMKMELPVRAPRAGTVTAVRCRTGELVQPGVALVEMA
jgi:biotin carboxyl carrier protein